MSSKNEILESLRRNQPPQVDAPQLDASHWIQYADPIAQFRDSVAAVGGQCLDAGADIKATLQSLPSFQQAERIYSLAEELPGNVEIAEVQTPHELADVDLCIGRGDWGVAENGAIWTASKAPHRVVFFLCQHLVLLLDRSKILHNMHQAYEKLSFSERGFGVFISGPSKTADIEQSLVIGAHGARSLHVLLTESGRVGD